MNRCKYVILDGIFPRLFSESDTHKYVARAPMSLGVKTPTSAGFCSVGVDAKGELEVSCYGKSESLGLESQPGDAEIIKRLFS